MTNELLLIAARLIVPLQLKAAQNTANKLADGTLPHANSANYPRQGPPRSSLD
jgi:hypothetical protein